MLSIHSGAMLLPATPPSPPTCRRTWHSLTETHRHDPFTAHWPPQKLQGAKCTRKDPGLFSCPWFVNTPAAVQQLPGLYLMTIKHLHEKVDKGRNSRGGLATKRPFYSVQSGRETGREGRRRGWEESWINELKVSWNSGRLNTFGFIKTSVRGGGWGGGGSGGVDSTSFFNFSPSERRGLPLSSAAHLIT